MEWSSVSAEHVRCILNEVRVLRPHHTSCVYPLCRKPSQRHLSFAAGNFDGDRDGSQEAECWVVGGEGTQAEHNILHRP